MVSDLIWASDIFGPREIWAPRNLVPIVKYLIDQISWGPNFLGPK